MHREKILRLASEQLDRVLGFFPRVDTKSSFLFGIDAGLLALLCLNLNLEDYRIWYVVVPGALAVGLILTSLFFVYRSNFPSLKGGSQSLFYFREIAARTEANFIDQFLKQDEDKLAQDILGQVWRNSEILKMKFDSIKVAFILTVVSLIPWSIFLAITTIQHFRVPILS